MTALRSDVPWGASTAPHQTEGGDVDGALAASIAFLLSTGSVIIDGAILPSDGGGCVCPRTPPLAPHPENRPDRPGGSTA